MFPVSIWVYFTEENAFVQVYEDFKQGFTFSTVASLHCVDVKTLQALFCRKLLLAEFKLLLAQFKLLLDEFEILLEEF